MSNIQDLGSFAVKNDGSEDFKKFVLEPLNEIRNIAISLQYVGANTEMYYGIDERGFPNCSYYYEGFSHILTVQQIKDYLLSGVRPGEEKSKTINMENVIITGFSNPTKEGVVLHLNKKASLKTGNIVSNEFWVSWDKIGHALFDGYTELQEVAERNELRTP